jgi:2-oxoglutarate ferredoxin oxidoreductase subunit alpha
MPANIGTVIGRYRKVLIPELNMGQLRTFIRAEFLVDAIGLNKIQGKPFAVGEIVERIESILAG